MIGKQIQALRRLLGRPAQELGRPERAVRFVFDLVRHCAHQLKRDQAGQMAAALTYRTIFSLVPVVVLMLLVFRAFGGFEQVQVDLEDRIYSYLGLSSITLPSIDAGVIPNDGVGGVEGVGGGGEYEQAQAEEPADAPTDVMQAVDVEDDVPDEQVDIALRASIQKIISDLTRQAAGANFGSIGAVGLLLLIWGALALIVTVERSFNQVFKCSTGRPWHLRVTIYWAVLTLGPVLLFVSLYVAEAFVGRVEGWFVQDPVGAMADHVAGRSGLLGSLSGLTALGSSWLLLFLSYLLLPNTRVRVRPALVGALLAAVLWESGKWGFKLYVTRAVSYSVLYGTLGLIPLFLLWVYLTWLIVLFGLEVTYTLQAMRGGVFEMEQAAQRASDQIDPVWLIPVMSVIATGFREGRTVAAQDLAQGLQLPHTTVDRLTAVLEKAGMIHLVQQNDGAGQDKFALARSPKNIRVAELLSLWHTASNVDRITEPAARAGATLLRELNQSQQKFAAEKTLEQVIEANNLEAKADAAPA